MNDTFGVEFEENNDFHIKSRTMLGISQTPSMVSFLLRTGIAKSEKQALAILIIFVVIVMGAVFFLVRHMNKEKEIYFLDKQGNRIEAVEYIEMIRNR